MMREQTAKDTLTGAIGWWWPSGVGKAHWYKSDKRSACGKYSFNSDRIEMGETDTAPQANDCRQCAKRVVEAELVLVDALKKGKS